MKKFFLALIIGIFVLSGLGAGAIKSNDVKPAFETNIYQEPSASLVPMAYTHTVLVEVGTATWCPSCPASNSAWHTIYASGNYDFEYTEMVYDMNSAANQRFNEFNPMWVPTSYFDAGEYVYPGTSIPTFYSYLNSCGGRVVPDIVANLDVAWLGSAKMDITYSVLNNEASAYPGKMRIYVIELESTLWNDYSGNPYNHALLDFAANQVINIPAGGSISDTITWDGVTEGFPGITQDNIQVILAVFDDTFHISYSDPPSGNPFNAYYSDECVAAIPTVQNNPPGKPTIDGPAEGKPNVALEFTFSAVDPDGDDISEFVVNWGDGTADQTITGPFTSGEDVQASYTWAASGSFVITAKAMDDKDAIGPVETQPVTIPRSRAYAPLYRFLENHPQLLLILKLVLHQI